MAIQSVKLHTRSVLDAGLGQLLRHEQHGRLQIGAFYPVKVHNRYTTVKAAMRHLSKSDTVLISPRPLAVFLEKMMAEAIIGGVFALAGSIVGIVGTYLVNRETKQNERNRQKMKSYLEQLKSFYNLERLYMSAVAKLREKLPDEQGSKTELGIQREFRDKNEENDENVSITMTSKKAKALLANME